jgi:hypothetical protein
MLKAYFTLVSLVLEDAQFGCPMAQQHSLQKDALLVRVLRRTFNCRVVNNSKIPTFDPKPIFSTH